MIRLRRNKPGGIQLSFKMNKNMESIWLRYRIESLRTGSAAPFLLFLLLMKTAPKAAKRER
jgi:hypothetical protein